MVPAWQKKLTAARAQAIESQLNLEKQKRSSRAASHGAEISRPVSAALSAATSQSAFAAVAEHHRRRREACVTEHSCWELIRQNELDARAELVVLAAKPGLTKALSEAGLLQANKMVRYRRPKFEPPDVSLPKPSKSVKWEPGKAFCL
eukprot:TRINITY_DN66066_c0_g1_i1.p1 TRINITY_DN66066_c0_g1~~TRINITY_DN66066_c0_g1_i1.p1  ORF type:complete len:148 (-),score=31.95 TRINITY_DN66066_c0_g1_i1:79-522(-)